MEALGFVSRRKEHVSLLYSFLLPQGARAEVTDLVQCAVSSGILSTRSGPATEGLPLELEAIAKCWEVSSRVVRHDLTAGRRQRRPGFLGVSSIPRNIPVPGNPWGRALEAAGTTLEVVELWRDLHLQSALTTDPVLLLVMLLQTMTSGCGKCFIVNCCL